MNKIVFLNINIVKSSVMGTETKFITSDTLQSLYFKTVHRIMNAW